MRRLLLQLLGFVLVTTALVAEDAPALAPAPAAKQPPRVYVIPVREEIGSAVLYIVRRGLKEAIEHQADAVVFDMKTPGGSLDKTFGIMEAIAKFPRTTITYVNSEAMSAGAFISATTEEIWFSPDGIIGAAAPVAAGGQEVDATMRLKIVSYLKARVRSMSEGKGYRGEVISAMIDADRELKIGDVVLKEKGELLSLTASEAARTYGDPAQPLLSAGTARTLDDLIHAKFGEGTVVVTRLEPTWSENAAVWLNSISPLLLGLGLLALFIEFKTPGFGLPGIVGISCLVIVFLGNYIAGLSGHEPMLVFGLGLLLVAVEIFFVPGVVVLALTGLLLIFGSLVWSMIDSWPGGVAPLAFTPETLVQPLTTIALGLAIAVALGLALARFLPRGWVWDRLVLAAAVDGNAQQVADVLPVIDALIGARGVAVTALRPSGEVLVAGKRYEATVAIGSIDAGAPVVVRSRASFGLVVEGERT